MSVLNNFTLRQLAYFVAAAEAGSTASAAEKLHMGQSSMSSALSELDAALGVELFVRRRGKGLTLTSVGQDLLPRARAVLKSANEVEAITRASQDEHTGLLRIGCFDVVAPAYLPRALAAFQAEYPEVLIEFTEGPQDKLISSLETNTIDVALTYLRGLPTNIATASVAAPIPHVVLPPDHRYASAHEVSLRMLSEDPFIQLLASPAKELTLDLFADNGAEPNILFGSTNYDHVRAMVHQGFGYSVIAQVPGFTPPHWGDAVATVPLTDPDRNNAIVVGYQKDSPLSKRARNFIAITRQTFAPAS